jgi:hypothetical protein
MPRYYFVSKSDDEDAEPVVGEFRDDGAAMDDARLALADMMRDASLELKAFNDSIEVRNDFGSVIGVVSLKSD